MSTFCSGVNFVYGPLFAGAEACTMWLPSPLIDAMEVDGIITYVTCFFPSAQKHMLDAEEEALSKRYIH